MLDQPHGVSVSAAPDGSVGFTVDLSIYPLAAVLGSGYVFVDRCYVFLDKPAEGKVRVSLSPKAGSEAVAATALAGDFQNQLLSQTLRHHVGQQHEKVRELIIARALFGAAPDVEAVAARGGPGGDDVDLLDQRLADSPDVPKEEDDFLDDPLGIGVPWEQRAAAKAEPAETPAATATTEDAEKGAGGETP